MPSPEFIEGSIAFYEDRLDIENPYLTARERSMLRDDWNQKAQDWFDGYHNAREIDIGGGDEFQV